MLRLKRLSVSSALIAIATVTFAAAPAWAAPEPPEALAPAPVFATTATLHGVLDSESGVFPVEEGTYEFLYKATKGASKAECESAGASKAPASPGIYFGLEPEAESQEVTGLVPSTEYVVCLSATNLKSETTVGSPVAFTTATPPEAPVTVSPAKSITVTSAVLEGTLNPHSSRAAGGYFAYSNPGGLLCTEGPTVGLEGFEGEQTGEALAVHTTLGGLQPHQRYVFCLVATNSAGETAPGNEVAVETSAEGPVVGSESVSAREASSATLEAQVNPNNQVTEYAFQYATNETLAGAVTVEGSSTLSGYGEQVASVETGPVLAQNTTYYYRVLAKNAKDEETVGKVGSFRTRGEPFYLNVSTSAVRQTTAILNATIDPGETETAYHFQYGATTAYGATIPAAGVNIGAGGENVVVGQQLTGLAPGTTYHYRVIASNTNGTIIGTDHTFTTLPSEPPVVSTGSTEGVTPSSATISGTVDTQGYETRYELDLGADTSYGSRIFGNAGVQAGTQTFTVVVDGLQPSTTYHYRIVATNIFGTVYGIDRTFATAAVPSLALSAPVAPTLSPAPSVIPVASTTITSTKPKPKPKLKPKPKKQHGKGKKKSSHGGGKGRK